jgi:hypothetical protein
MIVSTSISRLTGAAGKYLADQKLFIATIDDFFK